MRVDKNPSRTMGTTIPLGRKTYRAESHPALEMKLPVSLTGMSQGTPYLNRYNGQLWYTLKGLGGELRSRSRRGR
ncbi:hypothetical protein [Metallosphaera javensis (ex Hofmann et al. 2022)]|uniref:hypothetical protein n=1 Tax=Metallosphaera javensis (ex Hofmann et al. 2022) TaxID=99938 RepID=UPI001EDD3779|nr:hypothetical protein [Metallosphaera javensis (ex Hofmann et al. 2022)]